MRQCGRQAVLIDKAVLITTMLMGMGVAMVTRMPTVRLPFYSPVVNETAHAFAWAALCPPAAATRPRLICQIMPCPTAMGILVETVQPLVGR